MNFKYFVIIIIPLVIVTGAEAALLLQLNSRLDQLSMQINKKDFSQTLSQNLPTLTPPKQNCENGFHGLHIESY